jgi:hypothetical protein
VPPPPRDIFPACTFFVVILQEWLSLAVIDDGEQLGPLSTLCSYAHIPSLTAAPLSTPLLPRPRLPRPTHIISIICSALFALQERLSLAVIDDGEQLGPLSPLLKEGDRGITAAWGRLHGTKVRASYCDSFTCGVCVCVVMAWEGHFDNTALLVRGDTGITAAWGRLHGTKVGSQLGIIQVVDAWHQSKGSNPSDESPCFEFCLPDQHQCTDAGLMIRDNFHVIELHVKKQATASMWQRCDTPAT